MSRTVHVPRQRIDDAVRALEPVLLDRLAALVQEDSTLGNEAGALARMAEWYEATGLDVRRIAVDPIMLDGQPGFSPPVLSDYRGRENVVGTYLPPAGAAGRSLVLNGHIDVVPPGPADLWTTPPFEPSIRDGRMYGRGAGDMKAGVVAALTAFEALRSLDLAPDAPIWFQSVIEEECTGNGALACVTAGERADAAIIPEPFDRSLLIGQVGVMWARLTVSGKPSHVLDTAAGQNALDALYCLCGHLSDRVESWNRPQVRHPLWADHPHPLNFNLGRAQGGDWNSTVPARAIGDVRVGFFPGQPLADVREAIMDTVADALRNDDALSGITAHVSWQGFQAEGCTMDPQAPMMQQLARCHEEILGRPVQHYASTATTDARFFQLYGNTPATCYGPQADSIHGIDESVDLESVRQVATVLACFISDWCGLVERRSATCG